MINFKNERKQEEAMSLMKQKEAGGSGALPRRFKTSRLLATLLVFGLLLTLLFMHERNQEKSNRKTQEMGIPSAVSLPANLEPRAIAQFDKLVQDHQIFYEESVAETVIDHGFQFSFRIVSFLDKKPISSPDSPDRGKSGGPFEDPRPEEIVTSVGRFHRLLLNKYCIYRPMFVLPTVRYAPQTDDLDGSDITAAWSVLKAFHTPQMVIYNCGANAGSSIGHKHLQIFPLPNTKNNVLFPAHAASTEEVADRITNVPFKHYVLLIPEKATAAVVLERYRILLARTKQALDEKRAGGDYNVVFTSDWIALIPRRTAVWGGPFGANAAGMVGMVTVPNQQQREQWAELGFTNYLTKLGIPLD